MILYVAHTAQEATPTILSQALDLLGKKYGQHTERLDPGAPVPHECVALFTLEDLKSFPTSYLRIIPRIREGMSKQEAEAIARIQERDLAKHGIHIAGRVARAKYAVLLRPRNELYTGKRLLGFQSALVEVIHRTGGSLPVIEGASTKRRIWEPNEQRTMC